MAQKYIISLSSIPPRFGEIATTLRSLLDQTVRPERVVLYLNRHYRRFPDWDGQPPKVPEGVEIRWVDQDWGPATKVLPAARDFKGQDVEILFCDDDQVYSPVLAERLLLARQAHPNDAVAVSGMQDYAPLTGRRRNHTLRPRRLFLWRVTNIAWRTRVWWRKLSSRLSGKAFVKLAPRTVLRPGYADGFEGWMGVMVRPEFFPEEAFDVPDFAWPVDDVWLSGHLMRNGHGAWIIGGFREPVLKPSSKLSHCDENALHRSEFEGSDRHVSNAEVARYFQETYGIWQ